MLIDEKKLVVEKVVENKYTTAKLNREE